MAQFQVPQFIEIDQKIIGGILTMRQFVFMSSGAGLILILSFFVDFFALIILGVFIAAIVMVASFLKLNGRSVSSLIKAAFFYYWNPSFYLWHAEDEYENNRNDALAPLSKLPNAPIKTYTDPLAILKKFKTYLNFKKENVPQAKEEIPTISLKTRASQTLTEITQKEEQISKQIQDVIGRISTRLKHPEKETKKQETIAPISEVLKIQDRRVEEIDIAPETVKVYPNIKPVSETLIVNKIEEQKILTPVSHIERELEKKIKENVVPIESFKTYSNIKPESEVKIEEKIPKQIPDVIELKQEIITPITNLPIIPKEKTNEFIPAKIEPEKPSEIIYEEPKQEVIAPVPQRPKKKEVIVEKNVNAPEIDKIYQRVEPVIKLEIEKNVSTETTKTYPEIKVEAKAEIREITPKPSIKMTASQTINKLSAIEERERLKISGHIQNLWEKISTTRDLIPKREKHMNIFQKERMEAEFQEMRKANGDIEMARHVDFK
ncbi:MAG: hypothetical protein Q8L47_05655 [bacterium]|nr:hypothetical protein [bacterium]